MNKNRKRKPLKIPHYVIDHIRELGHNHLIIAYLRKLEILDEAKGRLKEVYYYSEDHNGNRKNFFGAGWQNEFGNWEVRNKYYKGCIGARGITFEQRHPKDLVVFNDYFDVLRNPVDSKSILIMNGQLNAAIAKAKGFSDISLMLENKIWSREFIKALPYATDKSLSLRNGKS